MEPLILLAAAGLVAAAIVGAAAMLRRRDAGEAGEAGDAGDAGGAHGVGGPDRGERPGEGPHGQDATSPGIPDHVEPAAAPAAAPAHLPAPDQAVAPTAVRVEQSGPSAPVRIERPARSRPTAAERTTLAALAAAAAAARDETTGDASGDASVDADPADLADVLGRLEPGRTLVVEGAAPRATATLAAALLDAAGDRAVLRVTPPGRHDRTDTSGAVVGAAVHEPLADLTELPVHDLPPDGVVLVEHADRHLRRGLDPAALVRLQAHVPQGHVVLVLGRRPEEGVIDDAREWLTAASALPAVGPDADTRDAAVDDVLAELAARAPVAVDVIEAVAHAAAAGRLPDVPVATVLRVAAGLAGGDVDAPVTPAALAEVLDVVAELDPHGRVLRCGGTGADGLPTTLGVDPLLVARCVDGVVELPVTLLAVLLDGDADDTELLEVARVVAGSPDPRLALPALDAIVAAGGRHATEARLVRGVVGDRLGRPSALDDYLRVVAAAEGAGGAAADGAGADGAGADGASGPAADLAVHARFLAAGLLEAGGDLDGAADAYRAVVDSEHPVHAAMAAFNLAWLAERSGDVDAAADAYRELASGTHRDAAPMAALNLASILQRAKRIAEAESWYRVAVGSAHHDAGPMAAVALGLMLERNRRPREARSLFRYAASSGHEEAAPAALRRLGAPHRAAELRGRGPGAR